MAIGFSRSHRDDTDGMALGMLNMPQEDVALIQSPDWIQFYLGLAFVAAQKSPDLQTQHGCFITDKKNRPLGFGFNGFPRGIDDSDLPRTRPDKYPWMYHAERNAIAHCAHRPENGTAYITGQSCNDCIYELWQHGIDTVYMADRHGTHKRSKEDEEWFKMFIQKTGIKIFYINPQLNWLKNII